MKRILLIAIIAVTMIGLFVANQMRLLAETPTATAGEAMQTANQFYEAGQYAQAAQAYQQLADQGYADSALFYNLGNAYFKLGDHGRAILNYRRAQQLAPRDPDIEANLALARERAVDQVELVDDASMLSQAGEAVQAWVTLDELAMMVLGLWILFVFLLLLFSSAQSNGAWRKGLQVVIIATAVALVVGVLALGSYLYAGGGQATGVIVATEVDVTSGPGSQYVAEFTLYSGAEVELVETRGSWVRLALPDGELEGWVPSNAVESLTG